MTDLELSVLFDYYQGRLDYNEETAETIEDLRQKGLLEEKEIWAQIEEAPNYSVSTLGRVKNNNTEKILKTYSWKGYQRLKLSVDGYKKDFRVHRLVAKAFIPNPKNLDQINHKDEDKANNCVWNLEWCNSLYNNNYGSKVIPVAQMDLEGNLINRYPSLTKASLATGIAESEISLAVNGKKRTAGNYIWKKGER